MASRLQDALGVRVRPTSLLHSNRVAAEDLAGQPADLLEDALAEFAASGGERAIVLPLFFGPSGAMEDYLPPRLQELSDRYPRCSFTLAPCLESPADDSAEVIAQEIQNQVLTTSQRHQFSSPAVILTDHGSPKPGVAAVRGRVAAALGARNDLAADSVMAASMERREGPEYAFNDPLLEVALKDLVKKGTREVVIALQFLFPGRHAGPKGDIVEIYETIQQQHPDLRVAMTDPIGESTGILQLLERRFRASV